MVKETYPFTPWHPSIHILNLTCWTGGLCMPSFKVMLTCLKSWAAQEWLGKKLSKVKRTFSITSWFFWLFHLKTSLRETPLLCFKILNFGFQNKTTRHGKSTQQITKPRTAQSTRRWVGELHFWPVLLTVTDVRFLYLDIRRWFSQSQTDARNSEMRQSDTDFTYQLSQTWQKRVSYYTWLGDSCLFD